MNSASIQRVWALTALFFIWAAALIAGLVSIALRTPVTTYYWPKPVEAAPILAPRGAIYAADGTPLAISLQNGDRVYPMGELAGQVIGYVKGQRSKDGHINTRHEENAGQAGAEMAFEGQLAGGADVYLTLDPALQTFAENALWPAVSQSGAEWGTLIAMESSSGKLLAVANAPKFNPDSPRGSPAKDARLTNYAFERLVEPGSTMKALTAAILLQQGAARMQDVVEAPMTRRVADRNIRDVVYHPGKLSLEGVLAYSSNVGMSTFVERIDAKTLYEYHRKLHLFDEDLLPGFKVWRPLHKKLQDIGAVELANLSFGQGISVTPLHLAAAFNALANDGVWLEPTLVEPLRERSGQRIFSPEVARQLRRVLAKHNAPRARLKGYSLAGKTGTAQISTGKGYRSSHTYAALYAGFIPATKPRLTVLVVLYNPKTSIFGSKVAAPIFRNFAEHALAYWGTPPHSSGLARSE